MEGVLIEPKCDTHDSADQQQHSFMVNFITQHSRAICVPNTFLSLADILLLAGTAGASRMVIPASTRISFRLNYVQGHVSPVNMHPGNLTGLNDLNPIPTFTGKLRIRLQAES